MIFNIKNFLGIFVFSLGLFFYYTGYKNIKYEKVEIKNFISNKTIINKKNHILNNNAVIEKKLEPQVDKKNIINYEEILITVKKNQTFSTIIGNYLSSNELIFDIINKIEEFFNLKNLKTGQNIYFYINPI